MLRNGGFSLDALKEKAKNSLSGFRDNNEYQYNQVTTPLLINGLYGDWTVGEMYTKIDEWKNNPKAWEAEHKEGQRQLGDSPFRKDWDKF
jgi:hypothetical protein